MKTANATTRVLSRLFLAGVIFYLLRGCLYLFFLNSWLDDGIYPAKGYWAATGYFQFYGSGVWMEYMPLYFLVTGYLQKLFTGPSILACRCLSLFCGLATLFIVYRLAAKLKDRFAADFSLWLLITNFIAMQYYATATPPALVVMLLTLSLYILAAEIPIIPKIIGSLVIMWLAVLTRRNMVLTYLLLVLYLLVSYHRKSEIVVILAAAVCVPVITLLPFCPGILELFRSSPLAGKILVKSGLISPETVGGVVNLFNRHEIFGFYLLFLRLNVLFFLFGGLLIALLGLLGWRKRLSGILAGLRCRPLYFFICLLYPLNLIFHMWGSVAVGGCPKCIIQYHNYFYPLGALAVGVGFGLLKDKVPAGRGRKVFTWLIVIMFASFPLWAKTWLLVKPTEQSPILTMKRTAAAIKARTEPRDKFFLLAEVHSLFLAERLPFSQQLNANFSYSTDGRTELVARKGFVNEALIKKWLGKDADWALIAPAQIEHIGSYGKAYKGMMTTVEQYLSRYFSYITTFNDWNGELILYKRQKPKLTPADR